MVLARRSERLALAVKRSLTDAVPCLPALPLPRATTLPDRVALSLSLAPAGAPVTLTVEPDLSALAIGSRRARTARPVPSAPEPPCPGVVGLPGVVGFGVPGAAPPRVT